MNIVLQRLRPPIWAGNPHSSGLLRQAISEVGRNALLLRFNSTIIVQAFAIRIAAERSADETQPDACSLCTFPPETPLPCRGAGESSGPQRGERYGKRLVCASDTHASRAAALDHSDCDRNAPAGRGIPLRHSLAANEQRHHDGELRRRERPRTHSARASGGDSEYSAVF